MPKLNPHRVPVRRLDPSQRTRSFAEIEQGYSPAEAMVEAARCLQCPAQPCVAACPAHNPIPTFIAAIRDGRFEDGIAALQQSSAFPAVCSRVCNQAEQCEGACVVGKRGEPIAIGRLERFLGDWERPRRLRPRRPARPTGRRVAIVGAGPCGMAASGRLAELGHTVDLYDALPTIGGVLAWGIPTFRLPAEVLAAEVERLEDLGVRFHGGVRLGRDLALDELFRRGASAVVLATGAPVPTLLDLPGADLPGVVDATEFLSAVRLRGERPAVRRVAVIGGGNTAMDAAQTAVRLGAEEVSVLYRRSRAEVPARREEVEAAEEEGVRFEFLVAPLRFLADESGRLAAVRCCRMRLGPPGPDGRPSPVPVPDEELELAADLAVLAIGYGPDPSLGAELQGVRLDARGQVVTDPATGRTTRPGVWAGGDLVAGPDTVVAAMAAGRRIALDVDRYLRVEAGPHDLAAG